MYAITREQPMRGLWLVSMTNGVGIWSDVTAERMTWDTYHDASMVRDDLNRTIVAEDHPVCLAVVSRAG